MPNRLLSRLLSPASPAPAQPAGRPASPWQYGPTVKNGLRIAAFAALGLALPLAALADEPVAEAAPPPAAPPAKKAPEAPKADAKKGDEAKAEKEPSPEDKAMRGVVVIERAGQPLALGGVLSGDGRILTALSPLGSGNDLDARYADGTVARVKLGHHDRPWDLALLVPQSGKWPEGVIASSREAVRPDATIRSFSLVKSKVTAVPLVLRAHRTLLGGDDKQLENAIEIGSRVSPLDLGSPIIDEDGRVVALLGRGHPLGMVLAAVLFAIGVYGVLVRRNGVLVLMSIELILNAVNINLVAFGAQHAGAAGQVFALFVIAVAAAEVGVGLAIVLLIYRNRRSIDLDQLDEMKG